MNLNKLRKFYDKQVYFKEVVAKTILPHVTYYCNLDSYRSE
jgi:hypothetical protein